MTGQDPIFEIQQYLRSLARDGYQIPLIIPDGIYGSETVNAVRVFQSLLGLPVTGRVDYDTWQALRASYEEVQRNNARSTPIYPFEEILREEREMVSRIDVKLPTLYVDSTVLNKYTIIGMLPEQKDSILKQMDILLEKGSIE